MGDINTHLIVNNIGPHLSLNHNGNLGNLRIGIYANNGSGKSFISRMFRLAENSISDTEITDSYMTLKQNSSLFKYVIKNQNDPVKQERILEISINRGSMHSVNNNTEYIFHVFNGDYVDENLAACKYSPNGNIEGYVLGKTNIDVSTEKANLKIQSDEKERLKLILDGIVISTLNKLNELGINKNTTEYKQVVFNNLFNIEKLEEKTFVQLKQMNQALKSIPTDLDDISQIQPPLFSDYNYEEIKVLVETPFSQSTIAEEFKYKIKSKEIFIESGMKIYNQKKDFCPFCEQSLGIDALSLITQYSNYFADVESKTRRLIDTQIANIKTARKAAQSFYSNYLSLNKNYNDIKLFFPSFADKNLPEVLEFKSFEQFDRLLNLLEQKKENLSRTDFSYSEICTQIQKLITDYSEKTILINKQINQLNAIKNDQSSEKLKLNKRLCVTSFYEAKLSNELNISKYKDTLSNIQEIEHDIAEKESQAKISKKAKVVESLMLFLNFFFKDKYVFDEETFSIKFQNEVLGNKVTNVLSDGEKSVVSFCYYLAETHRLLTHENDYQKLFFVIDDPISSMDFHYVYAVTQIIRNLKSYYGIEKPRYLILTHNIEFMSILIHNKIISGNYILENSQLKSLKSELVMPYEAHLLDIYNVAIGVKEPNHTIPNSIRHIIETINRFENPVKEFEDYFKEISEFDNNEYLYSLIQDCSHGRIRQQHAYTNESIKEGCSKVISFIESKYQGQIDKIRN